MAQLNIAPYFKDMVNLPGRPPFWSRGCIFKSSCYSGKGFLNLGHIMPENNLNLLFLDVETTGHYPLRKVSAGPIPWAFQHNHEMIELGAAVSDPTVNEIVPGGEFEIKIEPSEYALEHVDPVAEKVNQFLARRAAGEWKHSVTLPVAMRKLLDFSRPFGKLVLGNQNFFFDWRFMSVATVSADITEPEWDEHFHYGMFDTRSMAIQELWHPGTPFNPSDYSVRQNQLCMTLGIPPEPLPHTAFHVFKRFSELKCERIKT